VDDNIINEVIIDLTNTGVMNETPEVPNTTLANEVVHQDKEPVSKQSKTSKWSNAKGEGCTWCFIVYSTSSTPTSLNYASPSIVTINQVQEMIGQAIDSFVEQYMLENEHFRLSMQNVITTQFSNLSVVLLQNLQQAQMTIVIP